MGCVNCIHYCEVVDIKNDVAKTKRLCRKNKRNVQELRISNLHASCASFSNEYYNGKRRKKEDE